MSKRADRIAAAKARPAEETATMRWRERARLVSNRIASGEPVYDPACLDRMLRQAKESPCKGRRRVRRSMMMATLRDKTMKSRARTVQADANDINPFGFPQFR